MFVETAKVIKQVEVQGGYSVLMMEAPRVAPAVQPGQFVHLRVPYMADSLLRRPFSVYWADAETLQILYKSVGKGTSTMRYLEPGDEVSIIGPLGHGFPRKQEDTFPIIIAGGYGMAALYLVARGASARGIAFFGGASAKDILCVSEFESLGWPVRATTEDGTLGMRGMVTEAIDAWWDKERPDQPVEAFVCGPNAMLQAVATRAIRHGWKAWVSVDRNMGCGVGACLTCVLKVRSGEGEWTWARSCTEGPVFECRNILWAEEEEDVNTKVVE